MLSAGPFGAEEDVRLGTIRDLPSIGLQVGMPAHMTDLPLDSLTDWARVGVKSEGDAYSQILVLSALPEGSFRDARTVAGSYIRQSERERKGYTVIEEKAVDWQSNGWEVLANYQVDGQSVTSLQWFGRRSGKPAIVYILTLDATNGSSESMRRILESVARSCKNTPIRPACTQPVRLGNRQILTQQGISLQIPDSLRMMEPNRKNMLIRAGAVDYLRDRLLPVITLTTHAVQEGETSQARLERSVTTLMPSLKPVGGRITSSQPAQIGDKPGFEVSFEVTQGRERLRTAMRLIVWRDAAWVLSMTWPASNVKELAEATDKVASSFRFQP